VEVVDDVEKLAVLLIDFRYLHTIGFVPFDERHLLLLLSSDSSYRRPCENREHQDLDRGASFWWTRFDH
jgi:hypothetical protein